MYYVKIKYLAMIAYMKFLNCNNDRILNGVIQNTEYSKGYNFRLV